MDIKNKKVHLPLISLGYSCNLSCKYCFPRGLEKKFDGFMSIKDFAKAIKWLKKQNIFQIYLTGGEPTFHPKFPEILDLCTKEKMIVGIVTNCLFKENIKKIIKKDTVHHVVVNYFPPEDKKIDHQRYEENLEKIKKEKILLSFFCKMPIPKRLYEDVALKAKKYNTTIHGRFLMPGFQGKEVSFSKKKKDMRTILDFLKVIEKHKIKFETMDVNLRCAFSDKEWEFLRKYNKKGSKLVVSRCIAGESFYKKDILPHLKKVGTKSDYTMRMLINPDLSVFPCFPVFAKGPKLTSFKNIDQISTLFGKFFEKWRWEIPLVKECRSCDYFLNRACQGGCLHHKYNKHYNGRMADIKEII